MNFQNKLSKVQEGFDAFSLGLNCRYVGESTSDLTENQLRLVKHILFNEDLTSHRQIYKIANVYMIRGNINDEKSVLMIYKESIDTMISSMKYNGESLKDELKNSWDYLISDQKTQLEDADITGSGVGKMFETENSYLQ